MVTSDLTPRQKRVVARMLEGMTNKEIAADLGISPEGVRLHIWRIIRRCGLRVTGDGRGQIIKLAAQNRL